MRVSTVEAKCKSCGQHFDAPLLSDFSYGDFVYTSQDGQLYKYVSAINNNTWSFIQSIVYGEIITKEKDELMQKIIGLIADTDTQIGLYQNKKLICPTCGRTNVKILDRDNVIGFIEIDKMTFNRFEGLSADEKKKEIGLLIK